MNIYYKGKVIEGVTMEMPGNYLICNENGITCDDCYDFKKHIESLPSFEVLNPPSEWKDGDDVTGKYELQFRVKYSITKDPNNYVVNYTRPYPSKDADEFIIQVDNNKEGTYSYDVVAIPTTKAEQTNPAEGTGKTADGTILQFLDGSHSYEGVWLGERHPTINGAFWWRAVLKEYFKKQIIEAVWHGRTDHDDICSLHDCEAYYNSTYKK